MKSPLHNEHWPIVWIDTGQSLPDTCITCGMFTDTRVKATLVHEQVQMVDSGGSAGDVAMGCLLHLLGPVGWIIAAIMMHDRDKQKIARTTKAKKSIRVPQCRLCRGMQPVEPVHHRANGALAFHVHPRFQERFDPNPPDNQRRKG